MSGAGTARFTQNWLLSQRALYYAFRGSLPPVICRDIPKK